MKEQIIPFYSHVRHKITGYTGIVICRAEHMWDCLRYEVQRTTKEDEDLPKSIMLGGPGLEIIAPPDKDIAPVTENPNAFEFGVKVKHVPTGFTGVIMACMKYPRTGNRYFIQPARLDAKGEIPETEIFDEEDLIQIDPPPKPKEEDHPRKPNGPHDRHSENDKHSINK